MTHVSPPRIIILVDTIVAPDERTSELHGRVERAIAMAASLASHAVDAGLSVGLVAWSDGWLKVPPNRGKRHRRELLGVLARLPYNAEHDARELVAQAMELQESSTTTVLFAPGGAEMTSSRNQSGLMVITATSDQSRRWFRFHPQIDFEHAMPEEQEPGASSQEPEEKPVHSGS
jgi:uncharacterized protein (DUF58 family)